MFDDDETIPWQDRAACLEVDPDLFFPPVGGDGAREAKRICRESCTVRLQCLEWALAGEEEHGILGGLSPVERKALQVQARRAS